MSKYNSKKVTVNGIVFDSKMEAEYYLHLVDLRVKGIVEVIELQPKFLLQEAFTKRGIRFRKIEYWADFKVTYSDGHIEIVDVKGVETEIFKIKKKLFEYKFKDLELKLITYVKKWGGWIEVSELNKKRKEAKKKNKGK